MGHDVARDRGRVRVTAPAAVRALMAGAIDYAGLFPPAALPMPDAVRNYSAYRAGPHAWMLGRFVLGVARLEELAEAFAALHPAPDGAWPLSVIARATDAAALAAFNARYASRLRIDTVEVPPVRAAEVGALAPLATSYAVFAEVDWADDPAPVIAELARHGLRAKIRTGGVEAKAFPSSAQVARFIEACRAARVPFKATAGLHHAWRGEYALTYDAGSARGTMFGFANVLLASVAATAGADAAEIAGTLEPAGPPAFEASDRGWLLPSGRAVPVELVAAARTHTMASFGSCSFEEPVQELSAQGLL